MSKTEQARLFWKEKLGKLEIKKNESWEKVISRLDSIILKIGIIFLKGKKTYIVAVTMIIYAVSAGSLGEMSWPQAILYIFNGPGLGALRLAVAGK